MPWKTTHVNGVPIAEVQARHDAERVLLSKRGHAIAALLNEAYRGPGHDPSPLTITQATKITTDPDFAARLKELL
uniref:Prevent-host-death protein n=1 Tax=Dinoroseobacter phage vB_DshS_R26L TaxID=3161158 RepID=A0AAU7VGP9_9CAUD